MEIKYQDIFPTRLWVADLAHLSEHFDSWQLEIQRLRDSDMTPRGKSNRLGWNSQPILLGLPAFKPLFEECSKAFNFALKSVSPNRDYRYHLRGWANVNDHGGYNTLHNHPDALMSGCFYLMVPEGSGDLVFRDPRPGVLLSPFQGVDVPNASNDIRLKPKTGMLAIFPNWLEHSVEPHLGNTPRISVAMNAQQAILPA